MSLFHFVNSELIVVYTLRYFYKVFLTSSLSTQDLVCVGGLSNLRQTLMDMKETVLETCVAELKSAVVGECVLSLSCVLDVPI